MKSIKPLINNNLNNLTDKFNLKNSKVYQSTSKNSFIVIFIEEKNDTNLNNNWDDINNVITEYLEEFISHEFVRWNIYIIFLLTEVVEDELKYKIEMDTYFTRKIVEDNYAFELTEYNIQKLISKHITFSDLNIEYTEPSNEEYISDSKVYFELKNIDKLSDDDRDKILTLLEKDENEI